MTRTEVVLLDASVLIPLVIFEHEHHSLVASWLGTERHFATCPITEGALVRHMFRLGVGAMASPTLVLLHGNPRHEFWPDALSYREFPLDPILGHRMVTDHYLVMLARSREARLASLDQALASIFPSDVMVPSARE